MIGMLDRDASDALKHINLKVIAAREAYLITLINMGRVAGISYLCVSRILSRLQKPAS